ncbi:MAG TPA: 4Fe-4S binding protein [Terracidiphilus sp.]|nr:4Fe-4S binding protein [Terracidiphilus sp.]
MPDRSQRIRQIVQWLFVALNAWIGLQFFSWVRYFEHGETGMVVPRPAGVEGWLPIAGLMNAKYLFLTGRVPAIHPAAMYLFLGFFLMSLLMKKAFCSWLCPIGTVSEYLWKMGRFILGRNFRPPRWLDLALRGLKYLLLSLFVVVIGSMSAEMLEGFMKTPYGLIADVKMLNFFLHVGFTAAIVMALLVVLSMLIQNFWCRYLCPYGALLGLASLLSPVKIRRDAEACIDCGKCARACPAHLPVDRLVQIRSVECSACLACVASCPAEDALQFALPPRRAAEAGQRWYRRVVRPLALAGILAYIFFGVVLWARVTNHWETRIPPAVYSRLVPHANEVSHPGL